MKNALVVSTQDPKTSPRVDEEKRPVKTPLEEMKEIYLTRKNQNALEKRFPTERGHTFYNSRGKPNK